MDSSTTRYLTCAGHRLVALLGLLLSLLGCTKETIPNTYVEDTKANREVIEFVEKYRVAVEKRDVGALIDMASHNYFDDMGTPGGDDDIDYAGLKSGLAQLRQELLAARYQISYRGLSYAANNRVLVDVLYTGWFRVETADGAQWRRRLEPHRLVLAREGTEFKILSGM
ncbi:MAG: hypothetical protein OXU20_07680 [Myxococcales bacterium]|nr:hypothetical protein [Myxococcales bacterium]MDD9967946.1 hypothetical protein [Myxococcales bacterium]